MSEKQPPSRREFLFWLRDSSLGLVGSAFLPTLVQSEPYPETLEVEERKQQIQMHRRDINLHVTSMGDPQLVKLNAQWEHFGEKNRPSPSVLEGAATRFSNSSIALKQFIVFTDQLRFEQKRGTIENQVAEKKQRMIDLLAMRSRLDNFENGTLLRTNSEPSTYLEATQRFLESEELDGFLAAKSDTDFGIRGDLQIWNHVEEQWAQSLRVMVCNTATYKTFSDLKDMELAMSDLDARFRWVIEIAYELFTKSRLAIRGEENNVSAICRFVAKDFSTHYDTAFPEYKATTTPLTYEFQAFGANLSKIFASTDFRDHIRSQITSAVQDQQVSYTVLYDGKTEIREATLDESSLILWLLTSYGIPYLLSGSMEDLQSLITQDSSKVVPGIPLGNIMQEREFSLLGKGHVLQRKIRSFGRKDSMSDICTGYYVVEEFNGSSGTQRVIETGMMTQEAGVGTYFSYSTGGIVKRYDTEMEQEHFGSIDGSETHLERRIVIYH